MLGSLAPNFGLQNAANRISGLPDVKIFWGGGGMPPDSPTRRGQRPLKVIAAYLCPNTRLLPKIMKSLTVFSVMEFNV